MGSRNGIARACRASALSTPYTPAPQIHTALQLHALELHRADVALAQHGESVEALLAALFAPEAPDAAEGGWQCGAQFTVHAMLSWPCWTRAGGAVGALGRGPACAC